VSYLARIGLSLAALWALPALGQVQGASSSPALGPERLQVPRVLDLRYGDALFLQFRGDDLDASARLGTVLDGELAPEHRQEAELLLGGLYLELGMHAEADRRLRRLLGDDVPVGVRNRAWFYLAKGWYLAGEPARAEATVRRLAGLLPPELEAQRIHLLANALTQQGRFAEAADQLDGWQGPADWLAYSRFNLGVALIRDNQLDVGAHYLRAVARAGEGSPELAALADLAGVTLAAAYLQGGDAELAGPVLAGVRVEGPHSNRALLLAGWASVMTDDPESALTPWLELRGRDPADPAVQESLLAIPYAYAQLGAPAQAATEYERALSVLAAQRASLAAALERARSGALADDLLAAAVDDGGRGWAWEFAKAPPPGDLGLLGGVLAGHAVHERLRDQRDLAYLQQRLGGREADLDAFAELLAARDRVQGDALARAAATLSSGRAGALAARLDAVSRQVDAAAADADPLAVAPADVQQRWERVLRLEGALAAPGAAAGSEDTLRQRARLLRGVQLWDAIDAQPGNLQARELGVSEAGGLLLETRERVDRLEAARAARSGSGVGVERLDAARAKLAATQSRLGAARAAGRESLSATMVDELEGRIRRIDGYEVQVRFALAALYDRASTPDPSAAPQPAPVTAPGAPGAAP
jgi:hypothetical protein